jgi:myo-inositol-1(or 4)-monophosphatase
MGRAHIYLHGKQMLWDYAAGLLIAEETACVAVTLDGESIFTESLQAKTALASIDENIQKQWVDFLY